LKNVLRPVYMTCSEMQRLLILDDFNVVLN